MARKPRKRLSPDERARQRVRCLYKHQGKLDEQIERAAYRLAILVDVKHELMGQGGRGPRGPNRKPTAPDAEAR